MKGHAALQAKLHFHAVSEQSSWAEDSRTVLALQRYKPRANLALKVKKKLCSSTEHSGVGLGKKTTKGGETQSTEENQSQTYLPLTSPLSLLCKDGLVLAKKSRFMSFRIVRNSVTLLCRTMNISHIHVKFSISQLYHRGTMTCKLHSYCSFSRAHFLEGSC